MVGVAELSVTIGDGVWIAAALLHREHPDRVDFTVHEIRDRLAAEGIVGPVRPSSIETHIRVHCVANARRDPSRLRMLFAAGTRSRRLFRSSDPYDPSREGGRIVPRADAIPERYRDLLGWYFSEYAPPREQSEGCDPILSLRGLGKEIWADEDPDAYVRRVREGWE
jgi:hypothetical protein